MPVQISSHILGGLRIGAAFAASGARTNYPLNTNSANSIIGIRYQARTADPITEVYVFMDDFAGTLASITMGCDIRNEHASVAAQPGSTVRATASAVTVPSAVDKWVKIEFATPYTPAVGEVLWIMVYNTSAVPTANYPMILTATNTGYLTGPSNYAAMFTSPSGFSTAGTYVPEAAFMIVQGSEVFGNTVTASATIYATSTLMRGIQFKPPVDVAICGWMGGGGTQYSGIRIYDADTPPAGTPLHSFALGTDTNQSRDEIIGSKIWTPVVLSGGRMHNIVMTYGSNVTLGGGVCEDYASFPAIFDGVVDYFQVCPAVSDVAGSWVPRLDAYPALQFIVSGFPPQGNRASYALGI